MCSRSTSGLGRAGTTFDSVVAAVENAVAAPERTLLVAHSGGAAIAPQVASRRPVRKLVLLAPPRPARSRSPNPPASVLACPNPSPRSSRSHCWP
ncbi:alpha/beta fold hydrolase [Amycolatopsis sp. NPDC004368]